MLLIKKVFYNVQMPQYYRRITVAATDFTSHQKSFDFFYLQSLKSVYLTSYGLPGLNGQ